MQSSMKDVACSNDGCPDFVVFQHIQFTATRPHVTSYCQRHKAEHDRQVRASKEQAQMPTKQPKPKTTEEIMADSAILVLNRLRELGTKDAQAALEKVKAAIQ